jgi:myo-inositol 2-dehydrogenase / D-chiro-inositol 1-dehydrogenase
MTDDAGRMTRPDRVRLGVVGLGSVAQAVHLPLLDRLVEHYEIAAVCDLSRSLLAQLGDRYRVASDARFTDAEAMLRHGRLDAVAVLSSGAHGRVATAVLDAGLPVFVEKPLAFSQAEADRLAAHDGAARLQVGYMKLYDPAVRRAAEAVDQARAGGATVRAIEVTVLHPSGPRQLWQARLLPRPEDVSEAVLEPLRDELAALQVDALGRAADQLGDLYAGVLLASVIHELALIREFDSDPVAIDAVDVWPDGAWPPSVGVTGRLASDARVDIRWHYLPEYAAYREIVRIVLDDRTVELEFPAPYYLHQPTRLTITEPDGEARRDVTFASAREAFEEELLAFHALVTEGARPRAGVAEARADVVTCQRIALRRAGQLGIAIGGEAAAL